MLSIFKKKEAPTMAQLIGELTAIADQKADMYREHRQGRAYGTKFHKLACLLAEAQKYAMQEGI